MNSVVDSFPQLLEFAQQYGLPVAKKRAIMREYLQVKILNLLYQEKTSVHLYFVGGTALRLLYGLDRFSEDLDFDTKNVSTTNITKLMNIILKKLHNENIQVELYENVTPKKSYFELRFPQLLQQLSLSQNRDEKLMIKVDGETFWKGHTREVILLNRYGFLVQVVSIPLGQLLVEKLVAYINRQQTLPRDIYDIIWLIAHQATLDWDFMRKNHISRNLVEHALSKFDHEKTKLKYFKLKLKPLLFNEAYDQKLELFPNMLEPLATG